MAWTAPRTWVTNELVTDAIGNTHWRDNLLALGPSTVGTTISGIQTAVGAIDGMRARLRVGTTPFDFLTLTYDATYARWVSETQWIPLTGNAAFSGTGVATATISALGNNAAQVGSNPVPWKTLDTAGLKLYCRITGIFGLEFTATTTTAIATAAIYGANVSAAGADANQANLQGLGSVNVGTSSGATAGTLLDTGFTSNTLTIYDYMTPTMYMYGTGTGTYSYFVKHVMFGWRWQSS